MFKKALNSKVYPCILTLLSVLAAISFRSCRQCWIFLTIGNGLNLGILLFICMVITSIWTVILSAMKIWDREFCNKKAYNNLLITISVFSLIFILFSLIYTIGYAPGEEWEVFTLCLKKTLKEGTLLLTIPFFVLFFPRFNSKAKKIIALISLITVAFLGLNEFYPLTPYKITADPMVIDNGKEYSIVFSTNDNGNGYIEYTYEGKNYKVYNSTGGRLNRGKIHSIAIPYEHLRNNTYKVSSTRVIEDFSYGSRRARTVTSSDYNFTYNDTDNQTWLVISDWHTHLTKANKAINNLGTEYDGVMLIGDSSPGVDFEEQIISNTIEFGGNVSGGTKPILYVRGNHETRGSFADELPVYLGIDQLYYTADIGPYSFVILDSGEDKADSHIEYGGMTDYGTYRADMIEWLKGVEVKNDKVIALSHARQISAVEPELSEIGWNELDRLGVRLMLSGHEHVYKIIENDTKHSDIVTYIDGGKTKNSYVASMLILDKNGFTLKAVDNLGAEILNEQFNW